MVDNILLPYDKMDFNEQLRDPFGAAVIAGGITAAYIHIKAKLNNEGVLPNHAYFKPAILVALLVYFIVSNGGAQREIISSDPY
jgi:hypothetical protein